MANEDQVRTTDTTDPRIDIVARAMIDTPIPTGFGGQRSCWPEWDSMDEVSREPWRRYAGAAIAALDRLKRKSA
jgi:hypothetical protein